MGRANTETRPDALPVNWRTSHTFEKAYATRQIDQCVAAVLACEATAAHSAKIYPEPIGVILQISSRRFALEL